MGALGTLGTAVNGMLHKKILTLNKPDSETIVLT